MRSCFLAFLFVLQIPLYAQTFVAHIDGERIICNTAAEPKVRIIEKSQGQRSYSIRYKPLNPAHAAIRVEYSGFSEEARLAFQRAVDIWSAHLITDIPIRIRAIFKRIESVAEAGPYSYHLRKVGFHVYYPVSLSNQRSDDDLSPGEPHIEVIVSTLFSNYFYFGLDGRPGKDQYDFVSLSLHEIAHGLGFNDSFRVINGEDNPKGQYGIGGERHPTIYDVFVFDHSTSVLPARLVKSVGYANPSSELYAAITGIKLFWHGNKTLKASEGFHPVLLWAPKNHSISSIAHLDDDAYPPGTPNTLMTPSLLSGHAVHQPGPIVLGMLADMGWKIRPQPLQIPHFGVGSGLSSDVVVTNRSSTEPAAVAIDVWDPEGNALDGNLILGVGADRFNLPPLGSRTLTLSHDGSDLLTGSITVSSDAPVSAVVRFDFQGTGITGVGTSPRLRAAIAPVRRSGNLSSGVAIRNPELTSQTVDLELKDEDGLVVPGGEASRHIEAGGRIAEFIEQFFPDADTTDFKGEISIRARAGQIAVIVLELEVGRAFTTLPVSPID